MSGKESSSREKICGLCNKNPSKYCCPRCERYLCSLDCYKSEKHTSCSENFYQDCVTQALTSQQPDDESRRRMMDILSRMHTHQDEIDDVLDHEDIDQSGEEQLDSDDEEALDLHDRIKGLDLNDADAIWNVLTDDEKNGFEAFLNQDDVGAVMPHWEPWWTYKKDEKPVEDIGKENKIEEEALKKVPVLKDVPILSSLTTVQPSPAIRFNITNVIASYTFITRYFNGEMDPIETTAYLFNICANLDSNANFDDYTTALESVVQKCLQSDLIQTDELSLEVMKNDTFKILLGPSNNKSYYCKAVLSHVSNILTEAKKLQKSPRTRETAKENNKFSKKFPEYKTEHLPKLDISKVKRSIKKVDYYLSFLAQFASYGNDNIELDGMSLSAHLKMKEIKDDRLSTIDTTT